MEMISLGSCCVEIFGPKLNLAHPESFEVSKHLVGFVRGVAGVGSGSQ
jgi:hypothetical protein